MCQQDFDRLITVQHLCMHCVENLEGVDARFPHTSSRPLPIPRARKVRVLSSFSNTSGSPKLMSRLHQQVHKSISTRRSHFTSLLPNLFHDITEIICQGMCCISPLCASKGLFEGKQQGVNLMIPDRHHPREAHMIPRLHQALLLATGASSGECSHQTALSLLAAP